MGPNVNLSKLLMKSVNSYVVNIGQYLIVMCYYNIYRLLVVLFFNNFFVKVGITLYFCWFKVLCLWAGYLYYEFWYLMYCILVSNCISCFFYLHIFLNLFIFWFDHCQMGTVCLAWLSILAMAYDNSLVHDHSTLELR